LLKKWEDAEINSDVLDYEMLAGNLAAILVGGFVSIAWSVIVSSCGPYNEQPLDHD
jgi:hypothetical protein